MISALVWIGLVLLAAGWLDRWEQRTLPEPRERGNHRTRGSYAATSGPARGSGNVYDWATE